MNMPILKPISNNLYEVVELYSWTLDNGDIVRVPAGYKTNGADIPRFFWRIYPPNSPEYMPAVVIHDYLCDVADEMKNKSYRKQAFLYADDAFREILLKIGVSKIKTSLFYRAVRLHHILKG